jgi:nucleotide-binding universal stress UspA family protein
VIEEAVVYQKIMLTHDASDLASQAVHHASMLAEATGAQVVVLQAVDSVGQLMAQMSSGTIEPMPAGPVTAEVAEESVAEQHKLAEQNLGHVRDALVAAGVPVEKISLVVVEGRPQDAIAQAVKDLGCDLVICATHGRSGIRRAVLGSVTDHLVRNTPGAPVLVVHLD